MREEKEKIQLINRLLLWATWAQFYWGLLKNHEECLIIVSLRYGKLGC